MKKKLLSIVLSLCMILTLLPTFALAEATTNVAFITKDNVTTNYTTLADAVAAAQSGDVITLLRNCSGTGIGTFVNTNNGQLTGVKNFTIDFGGFTYNVTGSAVGSAGYLSQGFHLEKGANVTLKNGTITSTSGSGVKMLVQNYCNLTLQDITLDGKNLDGGTPCYTLSNNCGAVNINGNTTITAKNADGIAFDACWAPNKGYAEGTQVTLDTTGSIAGNIEFDLWGTNADTGCLTTVDIKNCNMTGSFLTSTLPEAAKTNINISGGYYTSDPSAYVASGYYTATSDKTGYPYMVKSGYAASITKDSVTTNYPTLAKAVAAAANGDTIKLMANVTLDSTISIDKNITIDLNGTTLTSTPATTFKITDFTLTMLDTATVKGNFTADYEAFRVAGDKTQQSDVNPKVVVSAGVNVVSKKDCCIFIYGKGAAADIYGSLTSKGYYATIQGNGNAESAGTTINIYNGASVIYSGENAGTDPDYCAMYIPQKGTLNIYGGTIRGNSALEIKAGTTTITGGTFEATGAVSHTTNSNGTSTTGYAVALVENTAYAVGSNITVNISGGYFKSPIALLQDSSRVGDETLSVSGGYFTSDPSAYVASGKVVGTSDKTGYTYMVKAVEANVKVDVGETVANHAPSEALGYRELEKVTVAPDASDTGLTAAGGNVASTVTSDDTASAKTALDTAGVKTTGETVTVVVQPKLLVTPQSYDLTHKELTLDIKAVYDEIATTKPDAIDTEGVTEGVAKNAVVTKVNEPMTVPDGTPVVIKVAIPAAMAVTTDAVVYPDLQIKHVKESGAIYYYTANVTKEAEVYYATFTVTHGFSTFTLQAADTRTLAVDYDSGIAQGNYSITDVGTTLPVPTKAGYTFTGWKFDGLDGVYTKLPDFWSGTTGPIADKSATAQFSAIIIDGGSTTDKYTLSFETNGGSAVKAVTAEKNAVIDLTKYAPTKEGYDFSGWYSDSKLTTAVTSVTMTKDITVYAKWTEKSQTAKLPFTDVPETAYYRDAVAWAVEKGVTSGVTATTFAPDRVCTRAETVTFLWRAMGSPEPTAANNPFTDVSANDYYYKAVLWAVEKGITKGTSDTTFSPAAPVTRAQTVTFLWRAAGMPAQSGSNPFTDVQTGAFYTDAVLWAGSEGITEGTGTTTFSPNLGCTRAQIVTFLYRYLAK